MTDFSSYFTSFSLNVFPKHTLCTFKMLPEIYYHGINAYGIYQTLISGCRYHESPPG